MSKQREKGKKKIPKEEGNKINYMHKDMLEFFFSVFGGRIPKHNFSSIVWRAFQKS
jgi:hypothetical protein